MQATGLGSWPDAHSRCGAPFLCLLLFLWISPKMERAGGEEEERKIKPEERRGKKKTEADRQKMARRGGGKGKGKGPGRLQSLLFLGCVQVQTFCRRVRLCEVETHFREHRRIQGKERILFNDHLDPVRSSSPLTLTADQPLQLCIITGRWSRLLLDLSLQRRVSCVQH